MAVKPIQSVQRALLVLETVAERQPIGVAALCRHLDLDKSTIQRVLVTLDKAGWIRATGEEITRWELSTRPLIVAHRGGGPTGLIERSRPEMLGLQETSGETVFLAIPDAGRIVAIYVLESHHLVRTAYCRQKEVQLARRSSRTSLPPKSPNTWVRHRVQNSSTSSTRPANAAGHWVWAQFNRERPHWAPRFSERTVDRSPQS